MKLNLYTLKLILINMQEIKKLGSFSYAKRHSKIKPIQTQADKKVFDQDKFDRYKKNKMNSERYQNTMEFINDKKEKENIENIRVQELEEKNRYHLENIKLSIIMNMKILITIQQKIHLLKIQ